MRRSPAQITAALTLASTVALAADFRLYIGTYTGPKSRGIYVCEFDDASGKLTAPRLAAELRSPSFLASTPDSRYIYAVSEIADHDGQKTGAVAALAPDPATGTLRLINQQPTGGGGPCHVSVNRAATHVFVANYGGGSISVLPIRSDGALAAASAIVQHEGSSINKQRQEGPHAHGIYIDDTGRWVVVSDLGLDRLCIYRFDAARGTLTAADPAFMAATPGAGPRHFGFQPGGSLACAINELDSTVCAYRFDAASGRLTLLDTVSTLPSPVPGSSTAEVFFSPDGRFIYGSNRGHDSIAVLGVDGSTGKLRSLQHEPTRGKTPRSFTIAPGGRWLLAANQGTDNITVFERNPDTGRLSPSGNEVSGVGSPVCLLFVERRSSP